MMRYGTIKRFFPDKGFGFLTGDDDIGDTYFQGTAICNAEEVSVNSLQTGMRVMYRPVTNQRGAASYHVYVLVDEPESAVAEGA
jgi:cold shock CspA family protein